MTAASTKLPGVRIHVHDRGSDGALDGILRLIELAAAPRKLTEVLNDMCSVTAGIAGVDVVSAYVREQTPDGAALVMYGNFGFPLHAVGSVRLALGEGITGFVAECMRPVSVAVAAEDTRNRPVPGLGEEQFPAFLGVPVMNGGRAAGVLVLQRRERQAFTADEVTLAVALTAPFAAALERAARAEQPARGARAVRLRGDGRVGGAAMGRARVVPTLNALRARGRRGATPLDEVIARLAADIGMLRDRLARRGATPPAALATAALLLDDARFRQHARDSIGEHGLLAGLTRVARDYARFAAPLAADDAFALGRARDVEELCVVLHARARRTRMLRVGRVLCAQRLGWPLAVVAATERAGALLVEDAATGDARAIAGAVGIPLIDGVAGLRAWARNDDLVVVDADAGAVQINPSSEAVVRFRHARRDAK